MIGYTFFDYKGVQWKRYQNVIMPLSLPCRGLYLRFIDAIYLLFVKRSLLIRWEEGFDSLLNSEWWHVVKDEEEDIQRLSGNTRSKIRRGGKVFYAAKCSRQYILDNGYSVYLSSFGRYEGFEKPLSLRQFRDSIESLPKETEFWGVFEKEAGRLVSFSENLVLDDSCFYVSLWFEPESLRKYCGYLLIHEMNKYYLNVKKLRYVSDGARSVRHKTNIHDFLEQKFLFRKAYSKLRVVYFPGFYLFISILYPFRGHLPDSSFGFIEKISVLLEQERIRRECLKLDKG
ncbi:MAG: hypothetical protein HWE39_15375 [Oceanospirillaceae bacterium]|nr:hypothetical protein [Oceanospirillaceae bacterium]